MGCENAIFSFFKQNNVDYLIQPKEQLVLFPCMNCGTAIEMCTVTTNWNCSNCNQQGNLVQLIKYFKDGNNLTIKIFNPKREKKHIMHMIQSLIKKYPDMEKEIIKIETKVDQIMQYYEKNPS